MDEEFFVPVEQVGKNHAFLNAACFGAQANHSFSKDILDIYESDFSYKNDLISAPDIFMHLFQKKYPDETHFKKENCDTYFWLDQVKSNQIYRTKDNAVTILPTSIIEPTWSHPDKALPADTLGLHWAGRGISSWLSKKSLSFLKSKNTSFCWLRELYYYLKFTMGDFKRKNKHS